MKIVTNDKMIARNRRIGQILTIAALVILGVGLYISFRPETLQLSLLALIVGFLVSQVGIYFGNRWGRSPRPDELLTSSLKGLNDQFTLYNYTAPASHLLVGPSGIWVLLPYNQRGTISYDHGRYRQKGGGLSLFYLKIFAQEGLGRPDIDVKAEVENMQRYLGKQLGDRELPAVNAAVIFTNPKAELKVEDAPVPTMGLDKLKDFIRKKVKENSRDISPETLKLITTSLPQPEVESKEKPEEKEEK